MQPHLANDLDAKNTTNPDYERIDANEREEAEAQRQIYKARDFVACSIRTIIGLSGTFGFNIPTADLDAIKEALVEGIYEQIKDSLVTLDTTTKDAILDQCQIKRSAPKRIIATPSARALVEASAKGAA